MRLAVLLRGHVRRVLTSRATVEMLAGLCDICDPHFYVSTWSRTEARGTWRPLRDRRDPVTVTEVAAYFEPLRSRLQTITVTCDDDPGPQITGPREGCVLASKMPILAWKRMWLGIWLGLCAIPHDRYEAILSLRLDYLHVHEHNRDRSMTPHTPDSLRQLIGGYCPARRPIRFMSREGRAPGAGAGPGVGCDNAIIATPRMMRELIRRFALDLDAILHRQRNDRLVHQEYLVAGEADRMMAEAQQRPVHEHPKDPYHE